MRYRTMNSLKPKALCPVRTFLMNVTMDLASMHAEPAPTTLIDASCWRCALGLARIRSQGRSF